MYSQALNNSYQVYKQLGEIVFPEHLCLLIIAFWMRYKNHILILISEVPASSTFHLDKRKYCLFVSP